MNKKVILKLVLLICLFLSIGSYVFADEDLTDIKIYIDKDIYKTEDEDGRQSIDVFYSEYSNKYDVNAINKYIYENSVNRIDSVIVVNISQFNILYEDMDNRFWKDLYMSADLFYCSSFGYSGDGVYATKVYIYTYMNQEEVNSILAKLNVEKQKYLSGIKKEWNELELGIYTSDYLAAMCSYNYDALADEEADKNYVYWPCHRITGALIEKKPVCEGYAKAFIYLLNQVGVDSKLVTSTTMGHAWNLMKINGKYYHLDITWNDKEAYPYSYYEYSIYSDAGFNSKRHYNFDNTGMAIDTTYDNLSWKDNNSNSSLLTYHDGYWYYTVSNGTRYQADLYKLDLRNYRLNDPIFVKTIQLPTLNYVSGSGYSIMGDCKYLYILSRDTIYKMDYSGNNLTRLFNKSDTSSYFLRFMPFDKKMNIYQGYLYLNSNQQYELASQSITVTNYTYEHDWSQDYIIDKEPTEFSDGQKSIHCLECEEIKEGSKVVLPKIVKNIRFEKNFYNLTFSQVFSLTPTIIDKSLDTKVTKLEIYPDQNFTAIPKDCYRIIQNSSGNMELNLDLSNCPESARGSHILKATDSTGYEVTTTIRIYALEDLYPRMVNNTLNVKVGETFNVTPQYYLDAPFNVTGVIDERHVVKYTSNPFAFEIRKNGDIGHPTIYFNGNYNSRININVITNDAFLDSVYLKDNYVYLNRFSNNLKLDDFISKTSGYTYKLISSSNQELAPTSNVGSNMKVRVYDNTSKLVGEYPLLIKGDISGNGKASLYDVFSLLRMIIKKEYDVYEGIIADYSCDDSVSMNDIYQLLKVVLKY